MLFAFYESMQFKNKIEQGNSAEAQAADFLKKQSGYAILRKNFRTRNGEIDLIAQSPNGALVFIEVRSSLRQSMWLRQTLWSKRKTQKLKKTIFHFVSSHRNLKYSCIQFDVVWIEGAQIEHWPKVWI